MRFVLANIAIFTFLTGTLFYQYFFQTPEVETAPVNLASAVASRTPAAAPAVLPSPSISKSLLEKKVVELDLKMNLACKDTQKDVVQSKNSLILNMKKCGKEFPKQITIENQTNGFTASLFSLNDSISKTDSIPLKKGKNVIVIKYLLAKTKSLPEREITERLAVQHD